MTVSMVTICGVVTHEPIRYPPHTEMSSKSKCWQSLNNNDQILDQCKYCHLPLPVWTRWWTLAHVKTYCLDLTWASGKLLLLILDWIHSKVIKFLNIERKWGRKLLEGTIKLLLFRENWTTFLIGNLRIWDSVVSNRICLNFQWGQRPS